MKRFNEEDLPVWQISPVYPDGHLQNCCPALFMHTPPLIHGLLQMLTAFIYEKIIRNHLMGVGNIYRK